MEQQKSSSISTCSICGAVLAANEEMPDPENSEKLICEDGCNANENYAG